MTESTRKPSARRQENARAQQEQNRTNRQVFSRRGAVMRAILAGASPEQLTGLLGRDAAGIPNSVLLDLFSRERPFVERPPLLSKPTAVEPFVWDSPFGTLETGAADALPATLFPVKSEKGGAYLTDAAVTEDSVFPADAAVTEDSVFPADAAVTEDSVFPADAAFTGDAAFAAEGGILGGAGGPGAAGPVSG